MKIDGSVIYSEIPESIIISENKFGKCLISRKNFKKGEIIYRGKMVLLENDEIYENYDLIISNSNNYNNLKLNKNKNFVQIGNLRQIYGFDGYMNHSCDPSTICKNLSETEYDVIAYKDILEGDEITCDYSLFDYECDGHEIEKCECCSEKCRGSMRGFKNLDLKTQIELLDLVDEEIFELFIKENKIINCGEIICPDCVKIKTINNLHSLISMKKYSVGDIIYSNESLIIVGTNKLLYKLENKYHIANDDLYIIRENFKEFLMFDSFMNHSCDPNTKINYVSENKYEMIAIHEIKENDELTCDYNCLDNNYLNISSVPFFEFECKCGSKNCRKIIYS